MRTFNPTMNFQRLFFALLLLLVLPWAHAATEVVTYYHNDALGSPVAATNSAGQLIWRESYQPYGKRQTGSVTANEQWFTGKQEEGVLGLQYFGARWYDQNTGRFVSMDPVGFQEGNLQSFNRYAYANNNPYKYVDPDGREGVSVNVSFDSGYQSYSGASLALGNAAIDIGKFSNEMAALLGSVLAFEAIPVAYAGLVGNVEKSAEANVVRDAFVESLEPLKGKAPATVSGGYNVRTGAVAARACGGGKCAEDHVVDALGGNKADV